MKREAVIFDMDGVVTDSEDLYAEAVNVVLQGTGQVMTAEDHQAIMGSSIDYTWEWAIRRYGLAGTIEDWKPPYDAAVERLLRERAPAMPGIHELLDRLRRRGTRIGLATSSKVNWMEAVLGRLGLAGCFESKAALEMVANAKPAPDLYLLAASGLGIAPERCVAIEDTPRGIAAAKAAGMLAIGLRTQATAHLDIAQADRIIDRLLDFDLAWLE